MTEMTMEQQTIRHATRETQKHVRFFPREHGATAMLFMPIVCAALLARAWRWSELAVLIAAFAALSAKDPMVILARQRFVWKQRHEETADAARWFAGWLALLIASGLVLLATWPIKATIAMGLGVAIFSALAIAVNVKNRQRSTLFQIASALALTSSSLAVCLSATGAIAPWCWQLWLLMAMQATTGILVVHARLDAKIAARLAAKNSAQKTQPDETFRRAAMFAIGVLLCAAVAAALAARPSIALALLAAVAGYAYDLRMQRRAAALDMPLTTVGQRALALSCIYAVLLIAGLW
jgi:hypothetical protein